MSETAYSTPATEIPQEAASKVTRRSFLSRAAAGTAVAAVAMPTIADAATPEHPWGKASRLASELSEALAEGDGAFGGPGRKWFAEVYPDGKGSYPVMFGNITAREWPQKHVSAPFQQVIDAHRQSRAAFEECCRETDVGPGKEPTKAARRRYNKAHLAEEKALIAVCAFRPHGRADARAKAKYLAPYVRWTELTERHITALIDAAVRS